MNEKSTSWEVDVQISGRIVIEGAQEGQTITREEIKNNLAQLVSIETEETDKLVASLAIVGTSKIEIIEFNPTGDEL